MTSILGYDFLKAALFLVVILVLVASVRVAPEFTRFAVYRRGRFRRVIGPGIFMILPIADRLVRFRADETTPDWAGMSFEQARQFVDRHRVPR